MQLFTILMPDGSPPKFKYHVVSWPDFRECMIGDTTKPEISSKVSEADIVCCGVDLTIDFMFVIVSHFIFDHVVE